MEKWNDLPGLLKGLFKSEPSRQLPKKGVRQQRLPIVEEKYEMEHRPGHSVLMGRFQVGNNMIQISHSQWEGDSYPMSLPQRKQILRMTVLERIRKRQLMT